MQDQPEQGQMSKKITVLWTCCGEDVFDQDEIINHLVNTHGIERPIRSTRTSVMHLDGPGWALNTYEHKVGDLVLHQTVKIDDDTAAEETG